MRRHLVFVSIWVLAGLMFGCGPEGSGVGAEPEPPPNPAPAAPSPAPVAPAAPISIAGRWGMRGQYSEGFAVEIVQNGDVLTGTMCIAGLPRPDSPQGILDECGSIVGGRIEGRRVRFGAHVPFSFGWDLAVDAFASQDGSRIAGRFFAAEDPPSGAEDPGWEVLPGAWSHLPGPGIPYYAQSDWFDLHGEGWPNDLSSSCSNFGGFDLTLTDATAGAQEFVAGRTYLLLFCRGVVSELGTFGGSELRFTAGADGATTTIEMGPVPETAPGLATSATVHLSAGAVTSVEARTPSGATYFFTAAPTTRDPF